MYTMIDTTTQIKHHIYNTIYTSPFIHGYRHDNISTTPDWQQHIDNISYTTTHRHKPVYSSFYNQHSYCTRYTTPRIHQRIFNNTSTTYKSTCRSQHVYNTSTTTTNAQQQIHNSIYTTTHTHQHTYNNIHIQQHIESTIYTTT